MSKEPVLELMVAGRKDGVPEGIVKEFGMDMYTLLYLKWITNKGLLYSTCNCSVLCGSLDGRTVWGRMDSCICISAFAVHLPETVTMLLIGYTSIQNKVVFFFRRVCSLSASIVGKNYGRFRHEPQGLFFYSADTIQYTQMNEIIHSRKKFRLDE